MPKIRGSLLSLPARSRQLGRQVARAVVKAEADRIVREGRSVWPVDTGLSQSRLRAKYWPNKATRQSAAIVDGSGYGPRIVSRGVRPWRDYMSEAVRVLVDSGSGARKIMNAILSVLRVRGGNGQ